MKDLIDKILKYLPQYFSDLGAVFSGPKRFIASRNFDADEAFGDACLFFGITMVILFILDASAAHLKQDESFWSYIGAEFGQDLIGVILAGGALWAAWRVVGGRATGTSMFATYMYFSATMTALWSLIYGITDGLLKTNNRKLYDELVAAVRNGKQPLSIEHMIESTSAKAALIILACGWFVTVIWTVISWGAFRKINGLSKLKSLLAFFIWFLFNIPVGVAIRSINSVIVPD
jgi:hypothetical protein